MACACHRVLVESRDVSDERAASPVPDRDAERPRCTAGPETRSGPVGVTGAVLALQRTAGNRAARAWLRSSAQRLSRDGSTASPPVQDLTQDPDWDAMTNLLDEAIDRSPTAAKHIRRAEQKGYQFVWNDTAGGTLTHAGYKIIGINRKGLTRQQQLVRVMYESGNAINQDLFEEVRRDRAAGKFSTGEQYARAVLNAESVTAVYASMKAVEAGLVYSTHLDGVVRKATQPDANGELQWRDPRARADVFAEAERYVWSNAKTTDESGKDIPAREYYARKFSNQ
jgi:hypothetical protein